MGQPLLVGHHSYAHAKKDAERIENGMRRAIKMWETAQYWKARAAGAIRHAKYKERPDVRARRIKGLETDQRREQKRLSEAQRFLKGWNRINDGTAKMKDGQPASPHQIALFLENYGHLSRSFPLADFPRDPPASQYEGDMSLWSALDAGVITADQAQAIAIPAYERAIEDAGRWLAHIANRLEYERAMLAE